MGLVRMVRPWDEWLIVWGYDINEPPPERRRGGRHARRPQPRRRRHDRRSRSRSTSLWGNNKMYATRYVEGRVFCMGDACHRHPPSNGLGSNTSIADAYNLAWKLALVLAGKAAPSLLDSYDAERAPIGKQIVLRANKSIEEFGPIFDALGLLDTDRPRADAGEHGDPQGELAGGAPRRGAKLQGGDRAQELRVQRARRRAGAALPLRRGRRRTARRSRSTRATPSCTTTPTTWPGARLPHAWLEHRGEQGLDARPRRQGAVHAADRHRRRGVGWTRRARSSAAHRRADRRAS